MVMCFFNLVLACPSPHVSQAYLGSMVLGHVLLQLCPGLQLAAVGAVHSVLEGARLMTGRRRK